MCEIRRAWTADAREVCILIRESITLLCGTDHAGDVDCIVNGSRRRRMSFAGSSSHTFSSPKVRARFSVAAIASDGRYRSTMVRPTAQVLRHQQSALEPP